MTHSYTRCEPRCLPDEHAFILADRYVQLVAFWAPELPPEWVQPLATSLYLSATDALEHENDPIRDWATARADAQPADLPWSIEVLSGNTTHTIGAAAATVRCARCADSLTRGMACIALRYFDVDMGKDGKVPAALHRYIDDYTPK